MISDFGLDEVKTSQIPLDPGYEKIQQTCSEFLPSNEQYQKLIGCLLFLSINTRPDIAASVALLAQKISKPTQYDWTELKRVVRYLKGTWNLKLHLSSECKTDMLMQIGVKTESTENQIQDKFLS